MAELLLPLVLRIRIRMHGSGLLPGSGTRKIQSWIRIWNKIISDPHHRLPWQIFGWILRENGTVWISANMTMLWLDLPWKEGWLNYPYMTPLWFDLTWEPKIAEFSLDMTKVFYWWIWHETSLFFSFLFMKLNWIGMDIGQVHWKYVDFWAYIKDIHLVWDMLILALYWEQRRQGKFFPPLPGSNDTQIENW